MGDHYRSSFKVLETYYMTIHRERCEAAEQEIGEGYFEFVDHLDYSFIRNFYVHAKLFERSIPDVAITPRSLRAVRGSEVRGNHDGTI